MKVDVLMPKMGESITEGTLIKWHKNKGDQVEKDEIIFEISTDKVDTEIPSPESGVLVDIKVFENETQWGDSWEFPASQPGHAGMLSTQVAFSRQGPLHWSEPCLCL